MNSSLPLLPSDRHRNPGRTTRHSRTRTPGQQAFRQGLGAYNLHGLGEGEGSTPWASSFVASQLMSDRAWSSQQRLCFAILDDAVKEYWKGQEFHSHRACRLAREAERWIRSDESAWPFSFVCICETLKWDAEWIRQGVLGRERRAA